MMVFQKQLPVRTKEGKKTRIADNRNLDPIKNLMGENTEPFEASVGETTKARQKLLFDAFKER